MLQSHSFGNPNETESSRLHFHFSLSCIGEGNGNPPQCSCLENPGDGGACWAAVYGVAQSRTRLKRLSSSSKFTGKSFDSPSLGDMPVTETDHVALEKDYYDWLGLIHLCLGGGP